jgi:two-component system phosphate regulon response regulator PhoB
MGRKHNQNALLIVEDDRAVGELLVQTFTEAGFEARLLGAGLEALRWAQANHPSAVLLDIGLPDMTGFDVCRELKADSQTARIPVIFVSGRESEIDRVVAFEIGASDYVQKPFSPRELVLRVRAILRRTTPSATESRLEVGPVVIDVSGYRVFVDGTRVELSPQEFRVLVALAGGNGRVLNRGELISTVWGEESEVQERTVDAHVKSLRAKLGEAGEVIETVRGIGYRVSRQPALVSQMSEALHQADTEPG